MESVSDLVGGSGRLWPAILTGLSVVPVSALSAYSTNYSCTDNGGIGAAWPGTPRGDWCQVVNTDNRWIGILLLPALVSGLIVFIAAGRGGRKLQAVSSALGMALAIVVLILSSNLRAFPSIG